MSRTIKILSSLFVAFLVSCSGENKKEPVDSESKVQTNEISDDTIKVPKELAPESFIEMLDLKNHQTAIAKDKDSKFKFSIDDFLIKKLQLHENFETDAEIYSVSIPNGISQNYHTIIVGIENTCCFYKTYIVTFSLGGKFIDKLLITEGDYIESFTNLKSNIAKNVISRTMYKANFDVEPSVDEVWKKDEFAIDSQGKFKGDDLIYNIENEKAEIDMQESAPSYINQSESDKAITSHSPFLGVWGPVTSPTIIADAGEEGYFISFEGGDAGFVKANINADSISGTNFSGKFTIKMISTNPPQLLYSDDGRGHFAPVEYKLKKNADNNNINQLIGKWQSTEDANSIMEYTPYAVLDYYDGELLSKEPYSLAPKCMNSSEVSRPLSSGCDYISVIGSDMCWYIESINENNLTLSYTARGNTLKYKRVK